MQALMKIIVFYMIIVYGTHFIIAFLKEKSDSDRVHLVKLLISSCCILFPILWHFIDLYQLAFQNMHDSNDIPLVSW